MHRPISIIKRSLVAAVVAISLVVPIGTSYAVGESAALEQTRKQISEIRKRLNEAKGRAAGIQREVSALQRQIDTLNGQIKSGQHDISELESGIRSIQSDIEAMEAKYRSASNASSERARRLYKAGPAEALSRLFSAKSIVEFSRLQILWEISSDLDAKVMLDATRLKEDLSENKANLNRVKSDLDAQRQWMKARRELVAGAQSEKTSALASVQKEISAEESHIKALEAQSRALEQEIRSRLSVSTGAVSRSGFVWPLRGAVTSPYGRRWGGFHSGIDIDGNTGNPIVASKAGTIAGVTCGSGYGICTVIDHGGGVSTLYAHQSRKAVSGGHVNQGQVIGYVGCTGSCTGSHLHFEVRVNGSPQNPRNFLP
ncbi:MAG: peptidoglycan DD-metalloendopeptidase family protein [Actinomycetota bacterium]